MKIQVLFFGIAKDLVGESIVEFKPNSNLSIHELENLILLRFPKFKELKNYSVAVNEEYSDRDYIIQNKDIIAIIPPVSGG